MSTALQTDLSMRSPERWLAVLRIVVGLWFLKAVFTKLSLKLLWGVLPIPTASERWINTMPTLVGRYADGNPLGFYQDFMQETVVTHGHLFAQLTAFGEVAVGVGLTFGFLTVLASGIGFWLVLNYGLATQWMSLGQQGFHLVLAALMIAFFATRAGRCWGVDGWLRTRSPQSWVTRFRLG